MVNDYHNDGQLIDFMHITNCDGINSIINPSMLLYITTYITTYYYILLYNSTYITTYYYVYINRKLSNVC